MQILRDQVTGGPAACERDRPQGTIGARVPAVAAVLGTLLVIVIAVMVVLVAVLTSLP